MGNIVNEKNPPINTNNPTPSQSREGGDPPKWDFSQVFNEDYSSKLAQSYMAANHQPLFVGDRLDGQTLPKQAPRFASANQDSLADALSASQTNKEKLAHGLHQMWGNTWTSFVGSIAGVADLFSAKNGNTGWNGSVNSWIVENQERIASQSPVHSPSDFLDRPFWERATSMEGTANALASAGFTIGMLGASTALSCIPYVGSILAMVSPIVGGYFEGNQEAMGVYNDYREAAYQEAKQGYQKDLAAGVSEEEANLRYQDALSRIESDARAQANHTATVTYGIAALSNILQFKSFYSTIGNLRKKITGDLMEGTLVKNSGWNKFRRNSKIDEPNKWKEYTTFQKAKETLTALTLTGLEEATEETIQSFVPEMFGRYSPINTFAEHAYSSDSRQAAETMLGAFGAAFSSVVENPAAIIDAAFQGFAAGFIGTPAITRNKKGKLTVGWAGGFAEAVDTWSSMNKSNAVMRQLNADIDARTEAMGGDKTLGALNHAARTILYGDLQEMAVRAQDEPAFNVATEMQNLNQLVNVFNLGGLDHMKQQIKRLKNLSAEEKQAILNDLNGPDGGLLFDKGVQITDLDKLLEERIKSAEQGLKDYSELYLDLRHRFPTLSDDALNEAVFHAYMNKAIGKEREKLLGQQIDIGNSGDVRKFFENRQEIYESMRSKAGKLISSFASKKGDANDRVGRLIPYLKYSKLLSRILSESPNAETIQTIINEELNSSNSIPQESRDFLKAVRDSIAKSGNIAELIQLTNEASEFATELGLDTDNLGSTTKSDKEILAEWQKLAEKKKKEFDTAFADKEYDMSEDTLEELQALLNSRKGITGRDILNLIEDKRKKLLKNSKSGLEDKESLETFFDISQLRTMLSMLKPVGKTQGPSIVESLSHLDALAKEHQQALANIATDPVTYNNRFERYKQQQKEDYTKFKAEQNKINAVNVLFKMIKKAQSEAPGKNVGWGMEKWESLVAFLSLCDSRGISLSEIKTLVQDEAWLLQEGILPLTDRPRAALLGALNTLSAIEEITFALKQIKNGKEQYELLMNTFIEQCSQAWALQFILYPEGIESSKWSNIYDIRRRFLPFEGDDLSILERVKQSIKEKNKEKVKPATITKFEEILRTTIQKLNEGEKFLNEIQLSNKQSQEKKQKDLSKKETLSQEEKEEVRETGAKYGKTHNWLPRNRNHKYTTATDDYRKAFEEGFNQERERIAQENKKKTKDARIAKLKKSLETLQADKYADIFYQKAIKALDEAIKTLENNFDLSDSEYQKLENNITKLIEEGRKQVLAFDEAKKKAKTQVENQVSSITATNQAITELRKNTIDKIENATTQQEIDESLTAFNEEFQKAQEEAQSSSEGNPAPAEQPEEQPEGQPGALEEKMPELIEPDNPQAKAEEENLEDIPELIKLEEGKSSGDTGQEAIDILSAPSESLQIVKATAAPIENLQWSDDFGVVHNGKNPEKIIKPEIQGENQASPLWRTNNDGEKYGERDYEELVRYLETKGVFKNMYGQNALPSGTKLSLEYVRFSGNKGVVRHAFMLYVDLPTPSGETHRHYVQCLSYEAANTIARELLEKMGEDPGSDAFTTLLNLEVNLDDSDNIIQTTLNQQGYVYQIEGYESGYPIKIQKGDGSYEVKTVYAPQPPIKGVTPEEYLIKQDDPNVPLQFFAIKGTSKKKVINLNDGSELTEIPDAMKRLPNGAYLLKTFGKQEYYIPVRYKKENTFLDEDLDSLLKVIKLFDIPSGKEGPHLFDYFKFPKGAQMSATKINRSTIQITNGNQSFTVTQTDTKWEIIEGPTHDNGSLLSLNEILKSWGAKINYPKVLGLGNIQQHIPLHNIFRIASAADLGVSTVIPSEFTQYSQVIVSRVDSKSTSKSSEKKGDPHLNKVDNPADQSLNKEKTGSTGQLNKDNLKGSPSKGKVNRRPRKTLTKAIANTKSLLPLTPDPKPEPIDLEKELGVLSRFLPQLLRENLIRIVNSLKEVNSSGEEYGNYVNNIITVSKASIQGTLYHEAFHYVVDKFFTPEEIEQMKSAYATKYGVSSEIAEAEWEEGCAEEFRKYMISEAKAMEYKGLRKFFYTLKKCLRAVLANSDLCYQMYNKIAFGKYAKIYKSDHIKADNPVKQKSSLTTKIRVKLEALGISSLEAEMLNRDLIDNIIYCS